MQPLALGDCRTSDRLQWRPAFLRHKMCRLEELPASCSPQTCKSGCCATDGEFPRQFCSVEATTVCKFPFKFVGHCAIPPHLFESRDEHWDETRCFCSSALRTLFCDRWSMTPTGDTMTSVARDVAAHGWPLWRRAITPQRRSLLGPTLRCKLMWLTESNLQCSSTWRPHDSPVLLLQWLNTLMTPMQHQLPAWWTLKFLLLLLRLHKSLVHFLSQKSLPHLSTTKSIRNRSLQGYSTAACYFSGNSSSSGRGVDSGTNCGDHRSASTGACGPHRKRNCTRANPPGPGAECRHRFGEPAISYHCWGFTGRWFVFSLGRVCLTRSDNPQYELHVDQQLRSCVQPNPSETVRCRGDDPESSGNLQLELHVDHQRWCSEHAWPPQKHREGDWKGCDAHQADDRVSIAGASNGGASNGGVWSGFWEAPSTNASHPIAWDHGKCSVPGSECVAAYAARLIVWTVYEMAIWARAWHLPTLLWVPLSFVLSLLVAEKNRLSFVYMLAMYMAIQTALFLSATAERVCSWRQRETALHRRGLRHSA